MLEFSSAVLNAKEKRIFGKQDQERMLKAPDRESAFSVLFDTDLSVIIQEEKEIEKIIEKDLKNLNILLKDILKEKEELFFYLFLKFDALNLKAILKKSDLRFPSIEENIERKIKGENIEINPFVTAMIQQAQSNIKTYSSKEIEIEVDKAYFQQKLVLAKKISKFLTEYTKTKIDTQNIKGLIKNNGFIEGGRLKKAELEKLIHHREGKIEQDLVKFLEVFELSHFLEHIKKDVDIDKALQSFNSEKVFAKEREIGFGVEKVLSFFQRKVNAHNNIRLILFGKEHNIPITEIQHNLLPL